MTGGRDADAARPRPEKAPHVGDATSTVAGPAAASPEPGDQSGDIQGVTGPEVGARDDAARDDASRGEPGGAGARGDDTDADAAVADAAGPDAAGDSSSENGSRSDRDEHDATTAPDVPADTHDAGGHARRGDTPDADDTPDAGDADDDADDADDADADDDDDAEGAANVVPSDEADVADGRDRDGAPGAAGPGDRADAGDGEHPAGAPRSGGAAPRDPADAARRRLGRALIPRLTRSQLLAAVVCAVLGFAIVVQANQAQVASLSSLRQSDLLTVLDNVTQESERLDDQVATLRQSLDQLRSTTDNVPAARQAAQSRLDTLGILAGTLPATGPGIELDVSDPKAAVNATDILETVQELRDAGAEAMQLGSARVVASTAFLDDPAGILVDRTVVSPPYRLLAIGDPQTLGAALQIPGGVLEVLRNKGAQGSVHAEQVVNITALLQAKTPQYARPATSAGS